MVNFTEETIKESKSTKYSSSLIAVTAPKRRGGLSFIGGEK
jgi:hypothetical protein